MRVRTYDPALTKAHLSNRFALSLVNYFSERFGEPVARQIVDDAGLSLEYLQDSERWISVEFDRRFCDAAARHLFQLSTSPAYDHPMWQLWRAAAGTMFKRQGMGPLWLLLWAMQGPDRFFADIEKMYTRGNRITRMRLVDHRPGFSSVLAVVTGEVVDRPGACWNRRGFFEAIPTIWNCPPARVKHTHCIHQSPHVQSCRYDIYYPKAPTIADPLVELSRIREYVQSTIPGLLRQLDDAHLEQRDAELHRRKIASYLPQHLLDAIRINPEEELVLGGRATEGAVLFADIKDFTRRCNSVGAGEAVRQLNIYFETIDAVILGHGGIIDKRSGDGVMVVFISPDGSQPLAVLAQAAVRCALEMQRVMPRCNKQIAELGGRPLQIRVGVAAGSLVLGNMGSRARLEYTVIGETVNLAARLEAAATPGNVLTLPQCIRDVELPASRRLRIVSAKGFGDVTAVELSPTEPPGDPSRSSPSLPRVLDYTPTDE
jgi:class 3 adenylate cyclase